MIRLDVANIPEAHIMKRWTRSAKDVVPGHLKVLRMSPVENKPVTYLKKMLNQSADGVINKGQLDMEIFKVIMKHFNEAHKEVDELLEARAKKSSISDELLEGRVKKRYISLASNIGGAPEDQSMCIQSDVEGIKVNTYGAAGSSATLSDTDILELRAPVRMKKRGRPRITRLHYKSEPSTKKVSNKVSIASSLGVAAKKVVTVTKGKPKTIKSKKDCNPEKGKEKMNESSELGELVHGLPRQSRFCSGCNAPGHNVTTCGGVGNPPIKRSSVGKGKKKQVIVCCSRCGLTGHNDGECMVSCSRCDLMGHNEDECLVIGDDCETYLNRPMRYLVSKDYFHLGAEIYLNFILDVEGKFS